MHSGYNNNHNNSHNNNHKNHSEHACIRDMCGGWGTWSESSYNQLQPQPKEQTDFSAQNHDGINFWNNLTNDNGVGNFPNSNTSQYIYDGGLCDCNGVWYTPYSEMTGEYNQSQLDEFRAITPENCDANNFWGNLSNENGKKDPTFFGNNIDDLCDNVAPWGISPYNETNPELLAFLMNSSSNECNENNFWSNDYKGTGDGDSFFGNPKYSNIDGLCDGNGPWCIPSPEVGGAFNQSQSHEFLTSLPPTTVGENDFWASVRNGNASNINTKYESICEETEIWGVSSYNPAQPQQEQLASDDSAPYDCDESNFDNLDNPMSEGNTHNKSTKNRRGTNGTAYTRDSAISAYNATNLIVNFLPLDMTERELSALFGTIGPIFTCNIMIDKRTGRSLGYGFVNFRRAKDSQYAIKYLNGVQVRNKHLKISYARPGCDSSKVTTLFVSHLPRNITEKQLMNIFGKYGSLIQLRILRSSRTGKSRCRAIVQYRRGEKAKLAIAALNGVMLERGRQPMVVRLAEDKFITEKDQQEPEPQQSEE